VVVSIRFATRPPAGALRYSAASVVECSYADDPVVE